MSRMVLMNKEGGVTVYGNSFQTLAESLQAKGLVDIDVEERCWHWKYPSRTLGYAKQEIEGKSGYTREEFIVEAAHDIVQHACKRLDYNLYLHKDLRG